MADQPLPYHVNPKTGAWGRCRAKVKCDFVTATNPTQNHYADPKEAKKASEKVLAQLHQKEQEGHKKKTPARQEFERNRDTVRSWLEANNPDLKLPQVRSKNELINKWFSGDEKKFDTTLKLADPNNGLTAPTKKSVEQLVAVGANVGFAHDGDSFADTDTKETSTVMLIDELDDDVLMQALKKRDYSGLGKVV